MFEKHHAFSDLPHHRPYLLPTTLPPPAPLDHLGLGGQDERVTHPRCQLKVQTQLDTHNYDSYASYSSKVGGNLG